MNSLGYPCLLPFSHFLKADGTATTWGNAEAGSEVWYDHPFKLQAKQHRCQDANVDVYQTFRFDVLVPQ